MYKRLYDSIIICFQLLFPFQVADPFYVFQFCSIILWSFDEYYYYAVAILIVSLVSIIITVYQTRMVSIYISKKKYLLLFKFIFALNFKFVLFMGMVMSDN